MTRRLALLLGAGIYRYARAQSQTSPFTQDDILHLLAAKAPDSTVAAEIRRNGIRFNPTQSVIATLRSRGLGNLAAAELVRRRPAAQPKATPAPAAVSPILPPDPNARVSRDFWESMPSSPPDVTAMAVGDSGEVYAGTNGHGVFRLDAGSDQWKDITGGLPNTQVTAMVWARLKNAKGILLVAAEPRQTRVNLFRLADQWTPVTPIDHGPLDEVTCLVVSEPGTILVGCWSAVLELTLEPEGWGLLAILSGYQVRALTSAGGSVSYGLEPESGEEYLRSGALGVCRLVGQESRRFDNGSLDDLVTAMAWTAPGTFYAGTASKGVFISQNNGISWKPLGCEAQGCVIVGDSFGRVVSLAAAKEGLYAALKGKGVIMWPPGGNAWSDFSQKLSGSPTVLVSSGSIMFAGTADGVFRRRR